MGLSTKTVQTGPNAGREVIDWENAAILAADMPTPWLWGALNDIRKTLESADAMDRADPSGTSDRGGLYRDEASVIRAELKDRAGRTLRHDLGWGMDEDYE